MNKKIIQKVMGQLLMLFSFTLLPPMVINAIYQEDAFITFSYSYLLLLGVGFILYFPVRKNKKELRIRDGFLIVVLFWLVLGIAGALPFYLYHGLDISLANALFESISGLTTTGSTILTNLDILPKSILFYRQELQWLGGMGIIVLAVAVMPLLGIGGMQLYKAEAPGPVKNNKLTPRIAESAKALWYIYLSLTISCAVAYWLAGMNVFDAISHSFSTVAIGGFSTYDASLGHFNNPAIEMVAIFFMFLGAINFALHFTAMRNSQSYKTLHIKTYFQDAEFKFYITVLFIISLLSFLSLYQHSTQYSVIEDLRVSIFQAVSFTTTAGFVTAPYWSWPAFIPVLLIFSSFIGGCAGSTGGGIKVIRILLLVKQGQREIMRLIHPNAEVTVKVGKLPVENSIMDAVWGFFAAYVALFVLIMLLLMYNGLDQVTAFSAVAATINNLGPGLGEVSQNFASLSDFNQLLLCFSMLLGRLEIFTLLVLFTPAFWQK